MELTIDISGYIRCFIFMGMLCLIPTNRIINQRKYQLLIMEGNMRSEQNSLIKKRNQIRNRLRKDEIQDYFEKRRKELLYYQQQSCPNSHRKLLDSPEKRNIFLMRIQSELEHSSPDSWGCILQQIKISIPFFEGNFDAWTKNKIILILFSVFNSQSSQLGIQHKIIKIITSILNSSKNLSCDFSGYLLYHYIVEQIVLFMKNFKMPLEQVKDFLHFFAFICRLGKNVRYELINNLSAGDFLISYGKELLQSELCSVQELRFNFLGLCGDYLTIFNHETRNLDPAFQIGVFSLVIEYIEIRGSERIIKQGLLCLHLLSKRNNVRVLKGFEQISIIKFLFQFSKFGQYRMFTLNILSNLSANGSEIVIKHLYQLDIFQLLLDINFEERDYRYLNLAVNTINNLTLLQSQIKDLLRHPIWNLILDALIHSVHNLREVAYHCIISVVTQAKSQDLQLSVLHSGKIIHHMINQASQFRKWPAQVTKEALLLMKRYIQILADQKRMRKLNDLESIYRLSSTLDDLVQNSQNDTVAEQALITSQIFAQAFMLNDSN